MGNYGGIDLSLTSTGLVVVTAKGNVAELCRFQPGKLRGVARLEFILESVLQALEAWDPLAIAIEGYAHGRTNKAHQLGEIGGVVRLELVRAGYDVHAVAPSVLKKTVTGKGNAGKPQMSVGVFKRWGFEHECDDVIDGFGLARCLAHHFEGDWPTQAMRKAWKMSPVWESADA